MCVLDGEWGLVGAVSITQLALSTPVRLAGELADRHGHRLVSVSPDTDREDAHRLMSRYSMGIIPVVDESRRVLGVIRAEEAMQIGEEEAEEDMLRIASAPGERVFGPLHLSNPAAQLPCHKSRSYFTIGAGAGAPGGEDEQAQHHVASWQSGLH